MAAGNYYLEVSGSQPDTVRAGLRWLLGSANQVVYIAAIQNSIIEHSLEDVIGRRPVREFIERGRATMDGHEAVLVTHRKPLYTPVETRLLALFPDRDFLDELDEIPHIQEMLVIPWAPEDIRSWQTTRNAVPLGQSQPPRTPRHLSDGVVEAAIRTLAGEVNQANGLVGGRDREIAVQVFSVLRDASLDYNPEEIKTFLIAECNWDASLAERAKIIAAQIRQGRRLRQGRRRFVPNILDIWRGEAEHRSN
jgi:hypothetical protein